MATLNIAITAPLSAFSNYADDLGYQAKVANPDYVPAAYDDNLVELTPAVGEPLIDNPETKATYLARRIKSIVATALADQAVRAVERTKQQEAKTEAETLRETIENAITISTS